MHRDRQREIAAGRIPGDRRRPPRQGREAAPGGDRVLDRRRKRMLRREPIVGREHLEAAPREGRPSACDASAASSRRNRRRAGRAAAVRRPPPPIRPACRRSGRRESARRAARDRHALEHALEVGEIAHVAEPRAHGEAQQGAEQTKSELGAKRPASRRSRAARRHRQAALRPACAGTCRAGCRTIRSGCRRAS